VARWLDVRRAVLSGADDRPKIPFEGPKVLAVDRHGDYAAAFSYSWEEGWSTVDITFAQLVGGVWAELATKGPRASGGPFWEHERLQGRRGSGYQERLHLDSSGSRFLTATAGYYGPDAVEVQAFSMQSGMQLSLLRQLEISSSFGAFVVVVDGSSDVVVVAYDKHGTMIGEPWPRRKT
jgi:hypothetical protein